MNFKKYYFLGKLFTNKLPSYLIFFVTAECNSRCRICFYWKNIEKFNKQKELSLDEIKKISNNFGHIHYLTFSGGEPLLRDDLPEIVNVFVKQNNTQFISIPTNGILSGKITGLFENMLRNCPEIFFRIALSIDGVGEEHDKIRGVPGNFEKIKKTYNLLDKLRQKYNNFNIDVTTVYSSFNQYNIKDIFNWVEQNFNIDNHVLVLARANTREAIAKNISIDGYEKAARFVEHKTFNKRDRRRDLRLKFLKAIKLVMREVIAKTVRHNRIVFPCVAGNKLVVINETGKVYPCELLNTVMGDLRKNDYNIKKILFSKKGNKIKKFIKDTKCFCTFECAIQNNIIYAPAAIPSILKKLILLK